MNIKNKLKSLIKGSFTPPLEGPGEASHSYLALDLGAESGRAIHGSLIDGKLIMQETHRFPNAFVEIHGHYYWDTARLFDELKKSLEITRAKRLNFESIGIDTWGVDFGLLASDGSMVGMPYSYRDHQTDNAIENFAAKVMSKKDLYLKTGLQLMQFNTIFQLYAMQQSRAPQFNKAVDLLFMPDLLNYLFTGIKKSEFTIASTSQLLNPYSKKWDASLFEALKIPLEWMQTIVEPGEIIGKIDTNIAKKAGIDQIPVVAVPSHDTQSAIAAIPAKGDNWAYLSSGTWSLMGVEVDHPIINEQSAEMEFTNEGGADGKYCFMKNLCGLWLLQECKKNWDMEKCYDYSQLTSMAAQVDKQEIFIDTDDPDFYNPSSMPMAIANFCKKTGQPIPSSIASTARCIFDSLTLKYLYTFNQIQKLSPKKIDTLHIIGGGSKNTLLCQLTSNALNIPVVAGPSEATALGNLLYQAKGLGHVKSLAEIRQISKNSVDTIEYKPQEHEKWKGLYEKYIKIIKR
jgi:rhamnulokinase